MLNIGDKAPNFTLKRKAAEGLEEYTLADNFGQKQTVILFVPLAFTPVCTKQFCQATEDFSVYNDLDAEVVGISVDSPFTLDAWGKASKMGIPLLSDMKKEVIDAYEVRDNELFDLGGVARRSAFVVNKDGKITYKWVSPHPQDYPPFDAIKEALKASQKVSS